MNKIHLETDFAGLQLKTPIIVGSSGLTDSVEKIEQLAAHGAGAVVLKSLFEEQILEDIKEAHSQNQMDAPELNEYVREYTRENTIANYLDLIRGAKAAVDIPVIASVNCIDSNNWVNFAKQIEEAGADALELNIALLSSDMQRTGKEIEDNYFKIINDVRDVVKLLSIVSTVLISMLRQERCFRRMC